MTYALCLVYLAVIYTRPGEIIPGWEGYPFADIAGTAAGLSASVSMALKPRRLPWLPIDWCFYGYMAAAVLSLPANGWIGGAYFAFMKLLSLAMFYLSVRIAVNTNRKLHVFIGVVIALTMFQAVNGIVQYHTGVGLGNTTAIEMRDPEAVNEEGESAIKRVRGSGIFGDPNDLAMALIIILPFLLSMAVGTGGGLARRLLGAGMLSAVVYAIALTQSRGGVMGMGALLAVQAYRRHGKYVSMLLVVLMIGAFVGLSSGRVGDIDASEESAQGRIQAWSAGLQMLRSNPILGVGFGGFLDNHERVAHNTYVHVLAETGLVGGYFFVGLFYWMFVWGSAARVVRDACMARLAELIFVSGIGVAATALFLSRQNSPVLYVPILLAACRVSAGAVDKENERLWKASDWTNLALVLAGVVVGTYVLVRILARWS
jgi:O-antigen ligase